VFADFFMLLYRPMCGLFCAAVLFNLLITI